MPEAADGRRLAQEAETPRREARPAGQPWLTAADAETRRRGSIPAVRGFYYCRECDATRPFRTVGYDRSLDLPPGRPDPEYRVCQVCGLTILSLADLPDSIGLVTNAVVAKARRRSSTGRQHQTAAYDPDDAAAHLMEQLWRLYRTWNPAVTSSARAPSFLGYAQHWLPRRLDDWVADVIQGGRRRKFTRPEERSLDGLLVELPDLREFVPFADERLVELVESFVPDGADRLAALVQGVSEDACDDRFRALLRVLPGRDRGRDGGVRGERPGAPQVAAP